jgi:apolipoprotein N-acyltransferase
VENASLVEQAPAASATATARPAPARPRSWVWLLPAGVLLLFTGGTAAVPVAAWLAPLFLLRFVRTQRAAVGLPVAYALLAATVLFRFRGMNPAPGALYYASLALFAVPALLPYAADRWLAPRLGGLAAVLVFPSAWAATEFLVSLSPAATWGSVAYSQYGQLPLLQVLSITGLWGVTFLIGAFASVGNRLWQEGLGSAPARATALGFAATLAVVLGLGGARMALFPPAAPVVRVASLSRERVASPPPVPDTWRRLSRGEATAADLAEFRRWGGAVCDDLLARSAREARAGAQIVFWAEANAPVLAEDEAALIDRGRELARKHRIYLGMALGTWRPGAGRPRQNKLVLVEPFGEVAWQYLKTYPVPGAEALTEPGDGHVPTVDTPHGRLGAVICYDADFPRLPARAGAAGADVLLVPSSDWRAIDPLHTRMASFRAIEQGLNLVRQTSDGLSAACDYQGKVLAAMDHYQAADHVMVAQVPTRGVRTVYSWAGDWFACLCLATLGVLAARALRRRPARAAG